MQQTQVFLVLVTELVLLGISALVYAKALKSLPNASSTNTIVPLQYTIATPTNIGKLWPFIPNQVYSKAFLVHSTVETSTGQSDPISISEFFATSFQQSLMFTIGTSVSIVPFGSGYIFLQGSAGLTISYSLALTNESTQDITVKRFSNVPFAANQRFALRMQDIYGAIVLFNTNVKQPRTCSVWSDEFPQPTSNNFVMESFLTEHDAFQLQIGPQNTNIQFAGFPNITFTVPDTLVTSKQEFLIVINQALVSAFNDATYLQVSFDTTPNQCAGTLLWTNNDSDPISIQLIGSDVQKSATAAMFGFYQSGSIVYEDPSAFQVLTVEAHNSIHSPSATIVKWPCIIPMPISTSPGSADSDGLVNVYSTPSTVDPQNPNSVLCVNPSFLRNPVLQIFPNAKVQVFYAPETTLGPFTSQLVDASGTTLLDNIQTTFNAVASGPQLQTLRLLSIEAQLDSTSTNYNLVHSLLTLASGPTGPTNYIVMQPDPSGPTIASNDVSGPLTSFAFASGPSGLFTLQNTTALFNALALQLNYASSTMTVQDDIQLHYQILDASLNVLYQLYINVSLQVPGTSVTRYTYQDSAMPACFMPNSSQNGSASGCVIEAWAAGGGSLRNFVTPYYGGASSRLVYQLSNYIDKLQVYVGSAGTNQTAVSCAGGQRTRVEISGTVLCDIGGGGGAGFGSHGGQGAAIAQHQLDTLAPTGPTGPFSTFQTFQRHAVFYNGLSSSTRAYDLNATEIGQQFGTQQQGPFLKPLGQFWQGSGSGYFNHLPTGPIEPFMPASFLDNVFQNGEPGYSIVQNTRQYGSTGGQGGSGFGSIYNWAPNSGGPGCAQNTLQNGILLRYGGGGGGSTMASTVGALSSATSYTTTSGQAVLPGNAAQNVIVLAKSYPPFSNNRRTVPYDIVGAPFGGGRYVGQFVGEPTGPNDVSEPEYPAMESDAVYGSDAYAPITQYDAGTMSMMRYWQSELQSMVQQESLGAQMLQSVLDLNCLPGAKLSALTNAACAMVPKDYVVSRPSTTTSFEQGYIPIGPHDPGIPGTGGSNLTLVSGGEVCATNNNFTLCFLDYGLFHALYPEQYIGTLLSNEYLQYEGSIAQIQFGRSRPNQLFQCVFITLYQAVPGLVQSNMDGFVWTSSQDPAYGTSGEHFPVLPSTNNGFAFGQGTAFYGTLQGSFAATYDITQRVQSNLNDTLVGAMYALMPNWNFTQEQPVWSATSAQLPPDSPSSNIPTYQYVQSMWPANSAFYTRSFVRQSTVANPSSSAQVLHQLEHAKTSRPIVLSFAYTGSVQLCAVPSTCKHVILHAIGAGGHRISNTIRVKDLDLPGANFGPTGAVLVASTNFVNTHHNGANGSYVRNSYTNLRNLILEVRVGKAGSSVPVQEQQLEFCGGTIQKNGNIWALGGGQSSVLVQGSQKRLLCAAGGGSAGLYSSALKEGQEPMHHFQGVVGAHTTSLGQSSSDLLSGPGGSGLLGGTSGKKGFGGGSGTSFGTKGSFKSFTSESFKSVPTYMSGIGLGSTVEASAGNGLVVVELYM